MSRHLRVWRPAASGTLFTATRPLICGYPCGRPVLAGRRSTACASGWAAPLYLDRVDSPSARDAHGAAQHGRDHPRGRRTSGAVRPADREPGLQAVPLPVGLRGLADPAARPLAARGGAARRRREGLAPQPERRRAQPADADLPLLHPGRCRGEQLLHEALLAGIQADRSADDAVGVLQHRDRAHRRLQPPARHDRHAGDSSIRPSSNTRR